MSEFTILNLALGGIGTATGLFALYLHESEKPHLKLEIRKCEHEYFSSASRNMTLVFFVAFQIRNLGIRGTRINDVGLVILKNGKGTFEIKKSNFNPLVNNFWINGDDILDFSAEFNIPSSSSKMDNIDCLFRVYQTHKVNLVKHTSTRRPPKPLMENLYE